MGHGLAAYAVSIAKLRASCGARRTALVEAVRRDCAELIVEIDQSFEREIRAGAPSAAAAVGELVDGQFGAKRSGAVMYAYALELLCAHLGVRLDAPVLQRTSAALLRLVDRVLHAHGVDAFTTRDLTGGRAPVKLPPRAGLPGIGALEPVVVRLASRQMAKATLSAADIPTGDRGAREAAYRAIEELAGWLAVADARGGLVCFYY